MKPHALPDTFGRAAPILRDAGRVPLPLGHNKAPLVLWKQYQSTHPTDAEFAAMLAEHGAVPLTGMPLAEHELVVDIDADDPGLAFELTDAAAQTMGRSDFARYGRTPRVQLIYAIDRPLSTHLAKRWDAVQLLTWGGQIAVAGPHPISGEPYCWKSARHVPWAATPPEVTPAQINAFLTEAHRIAPPPVQPKLAGQGAANLGLSGYFRSLVPTFGPERALRMALEVVVEGERHSALISLVGAATGRGLDDEQIILAVHAGTIGWTWSRAELDRELDRALAHVRAAEAQAEPFTPMIKIAPPRGPKLTQMQRKLRKRTT